MTSVQGKTSVTQIVILTNYKLSFFLNISFNLFLPDDKVYFFQNLISIVIELIKMSIVQHTKIFTLHHHNTLTESPVLYIYMFCAI